MVPWGNRVYAYAYGLPGVYLGKYVDVGDDLVLDLEVPCQALQAQVRDVEVDAEPTPAPQRGKAPGSTTARADTGGACSGSEGGLPGREGSGE